MRARWPASATSIGWASLASLSADYLHTFAQEGAGPAVDLVVHWSEGGELPSILHFSALSDTPQDGLASLFSAASLTRWPTVPGGLAQRGLISAARPVLPVSAWRR